MPISKFKLIEIIDSQMTVSRKVEKLSKTEKNLRIEEILGTRSSSSSSSSESEVNTPRHPFDDTPTATPRGFLEEEARQALQILRAQGGR